MMDDNLPTHMHEKQNAYEAYVSTSATMRALLSIYSFAVGMTAAYIINYYTIILVRAACFGALFTGRHHAPTGYM